MSRKIEIYDYLVELLTGKCKRLRRLTKTGGWWSGFPLAVFVPEESMYEYRGDDGKRGVFLFRRSWREKRKSGFFARLFGRTEWERCFSVSSSEFMPDTEPLDERQGIVLKELIDSNLRR